MHASPPVVVPLTYLLRKSAWKDPDEEYENLARSIRRPNPLFLKNAQLIILGDGPSGGGLGIPTIIGGRQKLQIFIAGKEITGNLSQNVPQPLVYGLGVRLLAVNPCGLYSQTIGRGQATFDIFDPESNLSIELGQTLLIQENGVRLFAGCIVTLIPEIFLKA